MIAPYTIHQLQALGRALETILPPPQACRVGHGLCILRASTLHAHDIPTWHVADLDANVCVLALAVGPYGYAVQHYQPGPCEATLQDWAQIACDKGAPMPDPIAIACEERHNVRTSTPAPRRPSLCGCPASAVGADAMSRGRDDAAGICTVPGAGASCRGAADAGREGDTMSDTPLTPLTPLAAQALAWCEGIGAPSLQAVLRALPRRVLLAALEKHENCPVCGLCQICHHCTCLAEAAQTMGLEP